VGLPNPLNTAQPFAARFGEVPHFNIIMVAIPFHGLLVAVRAFAGSLILVILFTIHFFISFSFDGLIIAQPGRFVKTFFEKS